MLSYVFTCKKSLPSEDVPGRPGVNLFIISPIDFEFLV
jgi:hypothetical protein